MNATAHKPSKSQILAEYTAEDYAHSMFEDGHNRTETNRNAHDAPAYDRAAHRIDPEITDQVMGATPHARSEETAHSRDGTDAVGALDEWGGSLGGTEKEIEDLEATAMPVDKTPQMKG